jgi:hypothetical protein
MMDADTFFKLVGLITVVVIVLMICVYVVGDIVGSNDIGWGPR